ncbi:hypothetical protein ACQSMR_000910 [Morganella morganii]
MAGKLDEAAKQILGSLLADFNDRKCTATDLREGYEGPQITLLSEAICNSNSVNQVDFDIALKGLEDKKLIKTGPMDIYTSENKGNAVFIMPFSYSKREYAFLSENGYREARKEPNKPTKVHRVTNVNISGGQFGNLQVATGDNSQQSLATNNAVSDAEIISQLISILMEHGQVVGDAQRSDIEAAVSEANKGNAGNAKSLLAKVCGPMWDSLQSTIWPIIGAVVAKSLGI